MPHIEAAPRDKDGRLLFVPIEAQLFGLAKLVGETAVRNVTKWEPHKNWEQCQTVMAKIPKELFKDFIESLYNVLGYDDEAASEKMWEFWAINAPPDVRIQAVCEMSMEPVWDYGDRDGG